MLWWNKKEKRKKLTRLKRETKNNKLVISHSSSQSQELTQVKGQNQQPPKISIYDNSAFADYRTKTLTKAISEASNTNSITVLKEQIYNLEYLSIMYGSTYFDLVHDLTLLDRLINFVERSRSLVDEKYTDDVWVIISKLYLLKAMLTNTRIFDISDIKQEANKLIGYASERLT